MSKLATGINTMNQRNPIPGESSFAKGRMTAKEMAMDNKKAAKPLST
jgi:hypothetical protein